METSSRLGPQFSSMGTRIQVRSTSMRIHLVFRRQVHQSKIADAGCSRLLEANSLHTAGQELTCSSILQIVVGSTKDMLLVRPLLFQRKSTELSTTQ